MQLVSGQNRKLHAKMIKLIFDIFVLKSCNPHDSVKIPSRAGGSPTDAGPDAPTRVPCVSFCAHRGLADAKRSFSEQTWPSVSTAGAAHEILGAEARRRCRSTGRGGATRCIFKKKQNCKGIVSPKIEFSAMEALLTLF